MTALLDAINADLVRQGFAVSPSGTPATSDIVSRYGLEYLQENDRPPRLVIEPGPPGGDAAAVGGTGFRVGGNARQLLTLTERYVAHCWGADEDDAKLLADAVRRALIQIGHGSITWGGAGETPNRDLHKGSEYVFTFAVNRPLLEMAHATGSGLRGAITYKMQFSASTFISCLDRRRVIIADPVTNTIALAANGLANADIVTVATTGSLPGGLTAGATYYVVGATADTFELALTSGGAAIDLTDAGTGVQYLVGPTPK